MIRKLHVALICSITLGSPAFAQSAVPEALYASIEAQDAFMRTIIRETFADQGEAVVERAFAVAGCESSGSPNEPIIHWETDGSGLLRNTAGGQARASFQVIGQGAARLGNSAASAGRRREAAFGIDQEQRAAKARPASRPPA